MARPIRRELNPIREREIEHTPRPGGIVAEERVLLR